MAVQGPLTLAATGSTGNNTHTGVNVNGYGNSQGASPFAVQFDVTVAGATPTVTFALQASLDGTNWYPVATFASNAATTSAAASQTVTAVGSTVWYAVPGIFAKNLRLVTSANTNITYDAALYGNS